MSFFTRREFAALASAFFSAIGARAKTVSDIIAEEIPDPNDPLLGLTGLKREEWRVIAIIADEIIPAGEKNASATQAGVLKFISNGFEEDFPAYQTFPKKSSKDRIRTGLAPYLPYYQKAVRRMEEMAQDKSGKPFVGLGKSSQADLVRVLSQSSKSDVGYRVAGTPSVAEISDLDLFSLIRRHVLEGYFSDPTHGGNRDYQGWRAIRHICHMNYPDRPETCRPHLVE